MRCAVCGKAAKAGRTEMVRTVTGHAFSATVRAYTCGACGEVFYDDAEVERVDLAIARALVDAGIESGAAFKLVRKAIGLRAADVAALLKVAKETVSRWETDKVPIDYGARALLGMMLADREAGATKTQDALRALAEPKSLGKRIALKVA